MALTSLDLKGPPGREVRVRVTRAFCIGGKRQEVGTDVVVPAYVAAELFAAHKADAAPEPVKPTKKES